MIYKKIHSSLNKEFEISKTKSGDYIFQLRNFNDSTADFFVINKLEIKNLIETLVDHIEFNELSYEKNNE